MGPQYARGINKHIKESNHDFFSEKGRIDLLRRMENHPNGKLFFAQLTYAGDNVEAIDDDGLIARSYITDANGALARAALEYLEGKGARSETNRGRTEPG
jgi:hypothetical protein